MEGERGSYWNIKLVMLSKTRTCSLSIQVYRNSGVGRYLPWDGEDEVSGKLLAGSKWWSGLNPDRHAICWFFAKY